MKINEFYSKQEQAIPFNVVDDLTIFMRNDPIFYRKHYFPMMANISDIHERGQSVDPIVLMKPVVDRGINTYCKKFNLGKKADRIFSNEDRSEVINKIYSEEMPYVKKGAYKANK
jgi:hypothetical protein